MQVVMTAGAQAFVTPLTFQAVSGREVRSDLWDHAAEAAMSHIELARWADLILVAPASADFLAHLAHGLADNLLTTMCLASDAPVAVAPAMSVKLAPPFALTCHCTVGVGLPVAAAVNLASVVSLWPYGGETTVWL